MNKATRVEVRDTTAWAIASILEYCPSAIPPAQLQVLMERLLMSLKDEPRVAVHGCDAFQQLIAYVEVNPKPPAQNPKHNLNLTPAQIAALTPTLPGG